LRKIRLSLRQILLKESKKRLNNLHDKVREFLQIERVFYGKEYYDQVRSFTNQKNKLRNELSHSIVVCGVCTDIEGDRVFSPRDKIWYCPKCYGILEEAYIKELKAAGRVN